MMTLTKREQRLLLILTEKEECITSQQLSSLFNLSSKTMRNEIKNLNHALVGFAVIQAIPAKGYLLKITDELQFNHLIQSFNRAWENLNPSNPLERAHYVLGILLKEDGFIKIDEVADRVYIDRTSVSRALKYVRNSLDKYGLNIIQKPGKGLCITGDEFCYRQCMAEYIYHKPESFITVVGQNKAFISEMKNVIFNDGIAIPEGAFQNFVIHLQVQIDRIKAGHYIHFTDEERKRIHGEYERLVALDVSQTVQRYFDVLFSEDEINYLTIHLLGKKSNSISAIESCIDHQLKKEIDDVVSQMFERIYRLFGLDLSKDMYLRKAIGIHITPMANRLKYNTHLRNPMLLSIKERYPFAYLISIEAWKAVSQYFSDLNIEDELGYLAIHFQYAMERRKRSTLKKNVLLVNDYSVAMGELAAMTILNKYKDKVAIERSVSISEFEHVDLTRYDFIISLVNAPLKASIPVIKIHPVTTSRDMAVLSRYFESRENHSLKSFLHKDEIYHFSAEDKASACEWICRQEMKNIGIKKEDFFHSAFLTGIELGNSLAYHYIFSDKKPNSIGVYYLDKPVFWENRLVKIVFVVRLGPVFEENEKMLEALSNLFEKDSIIESALKEFSLENIYHLFAKIE